MFKSRLLHSCLVVVLFVSGALIRPAAANALTTENLLVNGDAELQRCTNDWTAQSSIPGWRGNAGCGHRALLFRVQFGG